MRPQDEPTLFSGSEFLDRTDASVGAESPTWSVGRLHRRIDGLFTEAFGGSLWVEGEIRNLNRSAKGHAYFNLIDSESAEDPNPPTLAVTLFDRERRAVNRFLRNNGGNVRISDGIQVRIRGQLSTYAARSSLQLRMSAIDPTFTLGVLDQQRERVLEALSRDQLLERNGHLPLSVAPYRVALITSIGSAAHADALDELCGSKLGLQVSVIDARVQGADAESSLLAALQTASTLDVDAVLLVRGGGARSDLAAFDLESVARQIAFMPLPVLTGIGHEVDTSVADMVAHTASKTPTAAAAMIVARVGASRQQIEADWSRIVTSSAGLLTRLDDTLTAAARNASRAATGHIDAQRHEVDHLWHRGSTAPIRTIDRLSTETDVNALRVRTSAAHAIERLSSRLDTLSAECRAHDPVRALAKGWSITRTTDGRIVRSAKELTLGDRIETTLADGLIISLIESSRF